MVRVLVNAPVKRGGTAEGSFRPHWMKGFYFNQLITRNTTEK